MNKGGTSMLGVNWGLMIPEVTLYEMLDWAT